MAISRRIDVVFASRGPLEGFHGGDVSGSTCGPTVECPTGHRDTHSTELRGRSSVVRRPRCCCVVAAWDSASEHHWLTQSSENDPTGLRHPMPSIVARSKTTVWRTLVPLACNCRACRRVLASRLTSADATRRAAPIGEHRQYVHEGLGIRRKTLKPDSVTFNTIQNGTPFRYPRSSSRK
jgi:hypothetical protein